VLKTCPNCKCVTKTWERLQTWPARLRCLACHHEFSAYEPLSKVGSEPLIIESFQPEISSFVLDAMERDGWTPQQVRALIADYRRIAGYGGPL
jgi:hypothetical protein